MSLEAPVVTCIRPKISSSATRPPYAIARRAGIARANLYQALEEEYAEDGASDVSAADVVDLSAHLHADGRLDWQFPAGTFVVNVVGCLVIGVLAGFAVKEDFFSAETRIFLFSGIMGGFTTFSAFGLETFYLLRRGELLAAGSNVVLSVVVGLIALWIGFICVPHSGGGFSKHPAPADASKNG
jgi:CrcB protein